MYTLKGKFTPRNIGKYRGDYRNIIFRSSWELKFMKYCDSNSNILEWGSEEVVIPYRSPLDNRVHRYFPDFYMKIKESNGVTKRYLIEVKPKRQTKPPAKQKRHIYEVSEFAKNQAKWEAAYNFCQDRRWHFKIITEDELKV